MATTPGEAAADTPWLGGTMLRWQANAGTTALRASFRDDPGLAGPLDPGCPAGGGWLRIATPTGSTPAIGLPCDAWVPAGGGWRVRTRPDAAGIAARVRWRSGRLALSVRGPTAALALDDDAAWAEIRLGVGSLGGCGRFSITGTGSGPRGRGPTAACAPACGDGVRDPDEACDAADPAAACCTAGCRQSRLCDRTGDGLVTIGCLGDSNSSSTPDVVTWCDRLSAHLPPGTRVVNASVVGLHAGRAFEPLADLLALHEPDVVLLALGTNDVAWVSGLVVSQRLQALDATARAACHGPGRCTTTLIATVPPVFPPYPHPRPVERAALLEALDTWVPPTGLVDFHGGMTPDDYHADGLHLADGGQQKRLERALARLRGD